jgi:hypothetical protein
LEFGISRGTLHDIRDELKACKRGEIEVEVSLGDETSFYCTLRQNHPTIQYTPNTSEPRFLSVVRALSEFESTVAHMRVENVDYTVRRYQKPHENHRSRTFADGRRLYEEKTKLFSVDDLMSNTRMKCSHEVVVDDERVVQALVESGEPEQYHRQSFIYYESGELPLAQFDCTTKRTSSSSTAKCNIELELHMSEVLRVYTDYESVCRLFSRLTEIVEPYMQNTTDRPLKCGHASYQVRNRQLPITLQKQHIRALQQYEYAATPKFDGTRRYILLDTKGILQATTDDPMEVSPICHGRLADDIQSGTPKNTTNNIIVLDTEFMSDGTYHVFDVIRDTTNNTHLKPLTERMTFVCFICKEYQNTIRDKNPDAPAIIPKQMIFDSLSCAIGVISEQYLNGPYQIDGVIFVPVNCTYAETCDKSRPDPVLKFKPLRLLTIDLGIDLRELDALHEDEKHRAVVYLSSGKSHVDIRCVLPKYRLNWVDMYALLRTEGADIVQFGANGALCIVECQIVQKSEVTQISPIRIRKDKPHANSKHVVSSNLQSIKELTDAESEMVRQSGDSTNLDDLSVIQYWLKGPRYTPTQIGHGQGDVMQLDSEFFTSMESAYAHKRVLFVSPANVFENIPSSHSSRMMLLQDSGCNNVQGIAQVRPEFILAEHERSFHAIYVVCIPNATTAQWAETKLLPARISATLTNGGVCVLLMSREDRFDLYAPISNMLNEAQLQCHITTLFKHWSAYVYKRKPSSVNSHTTRYTNRTHDARPGSSLQDAQQFFNDNAQSLLDSIP